MKKLTAVVAAVAALGMATPSWGNTYDHRTSGVILSRGEILGPLENHLLVLHGGRAFLCGVNIHRTYFELMCVDSVKP